MVRTRADGGAVKPGHVGCIYQALNASYVGRSRKETIILDAAGRVVSRRALSKIRNEESGAAYAYRALVAAGAPARLLNEDGPTYVERALASGPFRKFRHPGNHAYVWAFDDVDVKLPTQAYPKARAA